MRIDRGMLALNAMARTLTGDDTKGWQPTKRSGNVAPDKPQGLTQVPHPKSPEMTNYEAGGKPIRQI